MIFIDTNVIMYAAGREHPYKSPCLNVIKNILMGEITAVTDVEALQEILYRYWHIGELSKGIQLFNDFMETVPTVLDVRKQDILRARDLLKKYPRITPRDAVHGAVMLNHKIRSIISADTDFDRIEGIIREDPLVISSRRLRIMSI